MALAYRTFVVYFLCSILIKEIVSTSSSLERRNSDSEEESIHCTLTTLHGFPTPGVLEPQEKLLCAETNPDCPLETYYHFSSSTEKDLMPKLGKSTHKRLTIPRSLVNGTNIIDTEGDPEAILIDDVEPIMPNKQGVRRVIIVHVTDSAGHAPSMSTSEASDRIFGTHGDTSTLVERYRACSNGKLKFQPGVGPNVEDGVLRINIKDNISDLYYNEVDLKVRKLLPNGLSADHIMMIFPIEVNFGGAAAWVSSYCAERIMSFHLGIVTEG